MKAVVYLDKTDVDAAIKAYVEAVGLKANGAVKVMDQSETEIGTVTATVAVEIPKPA